MTVAAYKDGILACDSMVVQGDVVVGEIRKLIAVPETAGGGWMVGAGPTAKVNQFIAKAIAGADPMPSDEEINVLWVRPGGAVFAVEADSIFEMVGPFHAIGSGMHVALGAMAAGATAVEAVQAACKICISCGGEVQWVSI